MPSTRLTVSLRPGTLAVLLFIGLGALAPATAQPGGQDPPKPADSQLTLTAVLDRADGKYVLGEDLQIEVKLENTSDKPVEVNELVFEEQSLSFGVTAEWKDGGKRDYVLAIVRPDPQLRSRISPGRVSLGAKKSLTLLRRFPTIAVGTFKITARYQSGQGESVAAPVTATVDASSGGSKLVVTVATVQNGSFSFELKPQEAPANVTSFVELVKRDFFRDMIFFRIINRNWIQTGCPYATGHGGPGYALKGEADAQTIVHDAGTVSMAGHDKHGYNGSQFFVSLARLPALDKKYTIIGKLIDGQLEVVNAIGKVETDKNTDKPRTDVRITNVTIAVK